MPKSRALIIEEVQGGFLVTSHDGAQRMTRAVAASLDEVLVQVRAAFRPTPDPLPFAFRGGGGGHVPELGSIVYGAAGDGQWHGGGGASSGSG